MLPRRDARRRGRGGRGRGAGRVQPETHASQQPASPASTQAPVQPHNVPDQLSAEAKHLRDFRKYNHKSFDGFLEDPVKAQMWLSSMETIFQYMKYPDNQKQEFLNLEQGDMMVEQYNAEFDMLSHFASDVIRDEVARTEKFVRGLRLDIQGLVRAFRPAFHADALRLAVDISLQERVNSLRERVDFRIEEEADRCPMRLTGIAQNQGVGTPQQGKVFTTNKFEAEKASALVIGMDWPAANHVSIDCSHREVVFNPPTGTSFKFEGRSFARRRHRLFIRISFLVGVLLYVPDLSTSFFPAVPHGSSSSLQATSVCEQPISKPHVPPIQDPFSRRLQLSTISHPSCGTVSYMIIACCAFFGITRLGTPNRKAKVTYEADRRGARRMREGHMGMSSF
ncbi:gag-protease polyprotein [Cucumis melo var. makuwa]|uniref:Gag-protease polyprotein n=1 Tax=Cucumis melo var. makuwa TaxID=1194695 RepID=A0A5D3BNC3_CUCMM|nr:gag-protease polyprotein [Cucumis melo var. makuwa]